MRKRTNSQLVKYRARFRYSLVPFNTGLKPNFPNYRRLGTPLDGTKYIGVNLSDDDVTSIRAGSGKELERVDDFVYLESRIMRTERDFEVRKGKAWGACHLLKTIWKTGTRKKIRLFRAKIRLYKSTNKSLCSCMGLRHGP